MNELVFFLLGQLKPYKYEFFYFSLVFLLPLTFLFSLVSDKFQHFVVGYCIFIMHRFASFEVISWSYTVFKGTQYGFEIHHVDLLLFPVFLAVTLKGELSNKIPNLPIGFFFLMITLIATIFTGLDAQDHLKIRKYFSILANLRQIIFLVLLFNLIKIERFQKVVIKTLMVIILWTVLYMLYQKYFLSFRFKAGNGNFMTYNQAGYIICPIAGGIFLSFFLNIKNSFIKKELVLLTAVLGGLSPILNENRGGQMNFFFTVLGTLGLDLLLKSNIKKVKTIIFLVFIAVMGLAKSFDTLYPRYFGWKKNIAGTYTRKSFYVVTWENFLHRPIFGMGANLYASRQIDTNEVLDRALSNTWWNEDPEFMRWRDNQIYASVNMDAWKTGRVGGVPESYWFLSFAEYGLIGFIPLIITWLYFIFHAFLNSFYFRTRNLYYYALSVGTFGALFGKMMHNLTEWCGRQTQALYFIAVQFALVALCSYVRKRKTYENNQIKNDFFGKDESKEIEMDVIKKPI